MINILIMDDNINWMTTNPKSLSVDFVSNMANFDAQDLGTIWVYHVGKIYVKNDLRMYSCCYN